jgi:cell division protein FtsQ
MSWFSKHNASSRRKGAGRSRILKKRGGSAERIILWSKRFGLVLGIVVFVGWLGSWFFMSGASIKLTNWAQDKVLTASANKGFKVANIFVEGREYTDVDALKAIVNINKGDPLFLFQPAPARAMLEKLSWVKTVQVERRLPDTIFIKLEERIPMALWQRNKRLSLIDTEGAVLTDNKLSRFKDLVVAVGDDVPERAPAFLKLLQSEPQILSKLEAIKSISGRRWNLILKSGAIVKLPENEIVLALRRLAVMQEEENIMDKNIKVIDVRDLARITVRTKPGAVREYKANFAKTLDASGNEI